MMDYASGSSTAQEQYFGLKLCSARFVIECAFGRLKARFGCLRRAIKLKRKNLFWEGYAYFLEEYT